MTADHFASKDPLVQAAWLQEGNWCSANCAWWRHHRGDSGNYTSPHLYQIGTAMSVIAVCMHVDSNKDSNRKFIVLLDFSCQNTSLTGVRYFQMC